MDPSLLHAADVNFYQSNAAFMGNADVGATFEDRDLHLTCCGIANAVFNMAFLKAPVRDLGACIERAEAFFSERGLPYRFAVRDDHTDLADQVAAAGYPEVARTPAMIMAPLRDAPRRSPELRIRRVETPEERIRFQQTAFAGFGLPPAAAALYLGERLQALPNVRLYLGTLDGEDACTSALVTTGAVAGIYWVATLERFRGRGLGEAATWAAIEAGRAAGCSWASLQASEMGRPVYERMGFDTPFHYRHFQRLGS